MFVAVLSCYATSENQAMPWSPSSRRPTRIHSVRPTMSYKPSRRAFLKLSAAAMAASTGELTHATPSPGRIAIVTDHSALVRTDPVQYALGVLRKAVTSAHLTDDDSAAALLIYVAPPDSPLATEFVHSSSITQSETVALIPSTHKGKPVILVTGVDERGMVYGLLELAERVRSSENPVSVLQLATSLIETTPNRIRSVSRGFCSEVEDKRWYYDRAFWTDYLDTLAAARFNRFALTFGLGYDFPRGVTGDYLHFPYPYLVEVPGFEEVHVKPALQPGERQRNLEALQFIAAETARRGLEFQLGIWTHAYEWTDSPNSDHHIVGLTTPEAHAAYCRDALALLLSACPQISGLTMRIHGESGIPEGSYSFWKTVWEAVATARAPDGKQRVIELDLHAKGLDPETIAIAHATGMPVKCGAKFWAEHCGLGYHQADIRAAEYPRQGVTGTFAVSNGARNFTRYGYGDFYKNDFGVELLYRVWPGTQRHLLWADPALASGYGRAANFCGAAGMEIMEPLFFKGREGSGQPGGRDAYAEKSLVAPREQAAAAQLEDIDSTKFTPTYMTWGRHLFNPDTDPAFYHRTFARQFGPASHALETALAASSRILPLITTAWLPSASNHEFWPEMLTSVQVLPYTERPLYTDNPAPHNVSAISPLDPQLFTSIDQHAENLVNNKQDARYNTSEVIAWLDSLVKTSSDALIESRATAGEKAHGAEFRRAQEDILILNGLGSFYAGLFRAGLFYSIHEKTGDPAAARRSLAAYRKARLSWADFSARAKSVYTADVSYGRPAFRRGNWADRLPTIDADLAALEQHFATAPQKSASATDALRRAESTRRPVIDAHHTPAASFHPGSDLALAISTPSTVREAILWYRHVNHGERWRSAPMRKSADSHSGTIPADYTNSPYPLQYYFELRTSSVSTLYPHFNSTWSNQPYYAISAH